ncbi:hypothetical protein [Mycolicibacterium mucogenicum]|uniref:Uncharacterized protein n=1 Tax=Mycolicibacterium mucogenicum DSM 44124 TaxID=1226753 RepID=A0A8H2JG63_MYCMU|nr:hypothetical protein [Mycolicibacterium mucogenicum]KAB7755224.1 hypothetical protein MMUC44124_20755 [Mycolicibacterium mucogenicum DSM 44124]QPG68897.1 hypothetical protein C1S78_026350 [Mycolicibacterium mucogenicum DSM 44124]
MRTYVTAPRTYATAPGQVEAFATFIDCLMRSKLTILWTTHGSRSALDRFQMLADLAKAPKVSPHVKRVFHSAGEQRIDFVNGSRIIFQARSSWHGRGFSNVDTLVFDEAEHLTDDVHDDLVPMQFGAANPETIRINHGVASHSS